jgi:predicted PurR-regulated permease PerM
MTAEVVRQANCRVKSPVMELCPPAGVGPGSAAMSIATMNQHVMRADPSERQGPERQRPDRQSFENYDFGLKLTDARPLSGIPALWRLAALVSTLGMGAIAVVAALYFGRSIILPVVAGLIIGITLAPAVKFGARLGIPSALSAVVIVLLLVAAVGTGLTFFAAPLSEWIARAPEIGTVVQEKLRVLDYPLSILREMKSAIMPAAAGGQTVSVEANPAEMVGAVLLVITPAVSQFVVFFGTLVFFLATSTSLRQRLVVAFVTREGRLRMLRIWNDIEQNLVGFVGMMTMINLGLGAVTTVMLYLVGFPNPVTFGLLTTLLNYVPYIGPAIVALVLFCVGLVAMPSLGHAALAPALFVIIATIEGHFVTPSLIGRRLTLSPLVVFLALAFWTWLWGPIGAFLAVPLVIVSFVVLGHLLPRDESTLPG